MSLGAGNPPSDSQTTSNSLLAETWPGLFLMDNDRGSTVKYKHQSLKSGLLTKLLNFIVNILVHLSPMALFHNRSFKAALKLERL